MIYKKVVKTQLLSISQNRTFHRDKKTMRQRESHWGGENTIRDLPICGVDQVEVNKMQSQLCHLLHENAK